MAKKKKEGNNDMLLVAVVGGLALWLWSDVKEWNKPLYNPTANYAQEIGAAPPRNTPAWQMWIGTAINFYDSIDHLFAPGGAFYNNNITQQDLDQYYDEVTTSGNGDIFTNDNGTLTRLIF